MKHLILFTLFPARNTIQALLYVEVLEVCRACGGFGLALGEEGVGVGRERASEGGEADFSVEELGIGHGRCLGVELERVFLARVVAIEVPVAALDGSLHFLLHMVHSNAYAVGETWCVGYDD